MNGLMLLDKKLIAAEGHFWWDKDYYDIDYYITV